MTYTILEDCSPYYIRFTFNGLPDVVKFITSQPLLSENSKDHYSIDKSLAYTHCNFAEDIGTTIVKMLPMSNIFSFNTKRVAIFDTPPNGGCGIHKDGTSIKVGINISVEVHDDKCITRWYDDEHFKDLVPSGLPYSRNVYRDFKNMEHFPALKSMVAGPNEMTIFNTNIFHSWHNKSTNRRRVLTLRIAECETTSVDEVKNKLFGSVAESGLSR